MSYSIGELQRHTHQYRHAKEHGGGDAMVWLKPAYADGGHRLYSDDDIRQALQHPRLGERRTDAARSNPYRVRSFARAITG
ncbi:MerR family DNA-binding transcriptional regulator [Salmonella enterica subsp. enterica]|nr:MerR family DNA-binding transcriptional regulator [Salmonella enterica subsp. enterica]